jgi:hypothetical protein
MAIYIFYHIFCCAQTQAILNDQITKILFSGLYAKVDLIHCFLTGEKKFITNVLNTLSLNGKKFNVTEIGENDTSFERFTIHRIAKYIKPEDKFLYIHTKGITRGNVAERVHAWSTYMEYFTMVHHQKCLTLLDQYDTVGTQWKTCPFKHYSGNFFWCTGSYFLTLPAIPNLANAKGKYEHTENYLGTNNPKAYSFMMSFPSTELYHFTFSPVNYIDVDVNADDSAVLARGGTVGGECGSKCDCGCLTRRK